jgi:hypothetical protein
MKLLKHRNLQTGLAAALLFIFRGVPAAHAQDISFSGSVKTAAGVYLHGDDTAGHLSEVKETAAAAIDATAGGCEAYITGNVSFDAIAANESGSFMPGAGLSADIREAWFDWTSGGSEKNLKVECKAGRQITAWGKADGIRIADVLCPQDLTTLTASNYSESRLGIDAVKLSLSGTYFAADAYWIPVFRPSALPLAGSSALRKAFIPESISAGGITLPVTTGTISSPEAKLANGSYAGRLSFWFPAADFSLYGYYGYDDRPVPDYTLILAGAVPAGISVSGAYYRYGMAGFDAAVPAGPFVFRTESAFFFDRALACTAGTVLNGGENYVRKNQLKALAGADWTHDSWTLTVQYYEDIVFAYDNTLDRDMREPGATMSLSRTFLQNTLTLSLSGAVCWNDLDSYASFSAAYALSDQITLTLSAKGYFPGPDADGEYGVYKDLSCIRLEGIYRF